MSVVLDENVTLTYCPADVCCQLVLDDKVEDGAGGSEPPPL